MFPATAEPTQPGYWAATQHLKEIRMNISAENRAKLETMSDDCFSRTGVRVDFCSLVEEGELAIASHPIDPEKLVVVRVG